MRILFAYAGKSGTCARACDTFVAALPCFEVRALDLTRESADPADFDYVLLGGAVRFGRVHKAARAFAKKYRKTLLEKPFSLFVCCANAQFFETYAERGFSKELANGARQVLYFGGELNVGAQKGIDKWVAKAMRTAVLDDEDGEALLPGFLPEHVRLLADQLRQEYAAEKK